MKLLSMAKFAKLHGVSAQSVTRWKRRGILVFRDGLVDLDASNQLLKLYRQKASGQMESPAGEGEGVTLPRSESAKRIEALEDEKNDQVKEIVRRVITASGAPMTIEEARRVKENYLAMMAQLEYDRESGSVVLVADVSKVVGEEYAKVRTRLLAIPAEQAPRLHRYKTVAEVQDALQEIITEALEELTAAAS